MLNAEKESINGLLFSITELSDRISKEWTDNIGVEFQKLFIQTLHTGLEVYLSTINQLDDLMKECSYLIDISNEVCQDFERY
jgi:hypothetical protein